MTTPDPTKPWAGYVQDQQYSAFQDRMIQIGKVNHQATVSGLNTRNGVFLGGGDGNSNINLNVRANGGMNLLVDAGSAIIDGYSVINPIQAAMTVQPATSVARRDAVILRVYDTEAGDAKSETKLEITKGTTTSDPPLPARSLLLAVIDVAANAVSVSPTDRRQFTTSVGGVVPYYGSRPDITTIANGQIVHSLNTRQNDQRDGDNYYPLGANFLTKGHVSFATTDTIQAGQLVTKQLDITLPRIANIVMIRSTLNFESLNDHFTVGEMRLYWDGYPYETFTWNTQGKQHMALTLETIVANQAPGSHYCQVGIIPTVGQSIALFGVTLQAFAIS